MSLIRRSIEQRMNTLYLSRLVRSPRGRSFLLAFMADAEESDEGAVFDALVARVEDAQLQKLVRRHRDDEARHARILREASLRASGGADVPQVPEELRIVLRIGRHVGGFAEDFAAGKAGVMEAYLLLQVIEERAVRQFPAIVRALAEVDPESAAVVAGVVRDEARHVKYAQAISRRYAPDAHALAATLARYREAEARAFLEHQQAFLRHALRERLIETGRVERLFWRALAA